MRTIEIAPRTIVFAVFFILGLYFLWLMQELLFSLLIAFILMSALKPAVRALEQKKIPRKIAAVIVYLLFIFFFVYLFSIIVPPIIVEGTALFRNFPYILRSINPDLSNWVQLESLTQYIPNVTGHAFEILGNIFSNVFFVVTTLFFGFYFVLEENIIRKFITRLVDEKKTSEIIAVFNRAEARMSAWFWGQITLMVVVGALTFIGLNLIGVKYALALAVLAGLLEVVPNIGPVISAVPAFIIAVSSSYFLGLTTIALYVIVQQLENNLIVPWIMRRAVGLDPIITLIALIIGGKIGGVLGVLLAIPLLLFVGTFAMEVRRNKNFMENFF